MPYLPPEEFMDALIASCHQTMACYLQVLKETAARPIEAIQIEWDDVNIAGKKLAIAHPAKGSNARIRSISDKLLQMLLALPSHQAQTQRVFPYKTVDFAGKTFRMQRKWAVVKLGNPELRKIDFYTFRYWWATYEYSKLNSEGAVMVLLGHKSLKYIFLYVQLSHIYFNGGNREYICKEAFTRQQEMQYIEQGYDYVRTDKDGVSLYRKLKE